ncbi:MAG: ABC transporter ATP-binding protein [Thermodesulfobacteriota bacterium]
MTAPNQTTRPAASPLRLVLPGFRKYAPRLAAGLAALLAVDLLQLAIPRFTRQAVDLLGAGKATHQELGLVAAAIVGLALSVAGGRYVWRSLLLGFSRFLERDLRGDLFGHLLTLDRPFFQKRPAGDLMAVASNDLAAIQLAGGMGLVAGADAAFMGLAALASMLYISTSLTLVAVLPMPLLAFVTRILSSRLHRRFLAVQEQFSRLTEQARSCVVNIRLLKAYTQLGRAGADFDRVGRELMANNLRLARVQGILTPVSGLVSNASLLLIMAYGGRLVISQAITMGDFVAFIAYLHLLTWPMMAVGWVANLCQRGATSLGRFQDIFDSRPALANPAEPLPLPAAIASLCGHGLCFSYPGQPGPALGPLDFVIQAGETVGIIGRSGSGKSTLCQILARLQPIPAGMLAVNGLEVNRLPLAGLRGRIAYAPQDVLLFSESIAANIALGDPEATQERIEAAARLCAIHEEIVAMPQGYQTRIGERGVTLSGGQRQRIALARAVLLDRPVLIIDDSLSAVDLATEQAIINGLRPHLAGRTAIIVSHRIAPLASADRILVLDNGRLVAQGSHAELLATSSFYATMYRQQQLAPDRTEAA